MEHLPHGALFSYSAFIQCAPISFFIGRGQSIIPACDSFLLYKLLRTVVYFYETKV